MVVTLAARYRGAKTMASNIRNTKAYQSKLAPTIPELKPILAKASNNDGVWNNDGDSLDLYVRPAWFQTVWFETLAGALLLVAIWIGYQAKVSRAKVAGPIRVQ